MNTQTVPPFLASDVRRFWERVERGDSDACWLWNGYRDRKGYGQFWLRHKQAVRAHRFAYTVMCGEIQPGMHVLHTCDVRNCVNWRHLRLGTNADNVADKLRKGRGATGEQIAASRKKPLPSGEDHWQNRTPWRRPYGLRNGAHTHPESVRRGDASGRAILSSDKVREIRRRLGAGEKQAVLAREYGVSPITISAVKQRRIWRHIE